MDVKNYSDAATGTKSRLTILTFDNSREFKSFSGVSRNIFELLCHLCENVTPSKNIEKEDKLLLVLVKLKLNVSFDVLAVMFKVSWKAARSYFYNVLDQIFEIVHKFIIWFDKGTIQARMPTSFKTLFLETRAIIDCSEIDCQRPSTQHQRVQIYSH